MTTSIKVTFREQTKCVTSDTTYESDELPPEEVLEQCRKLALDAQALARAMTLTKLR